MEIVWSLNRSLIYDTYFSLNRAILTGGKSGGNARGNVRILCCIILLYRLCHRCWSNDLERASPRSEAASKWNLLSLSPAFKHRCKTFKHRCKKAFYVYIIFIKNAFFNVFLSVLFFNGKNFN